MRSSLGAHALALVLLATGCRGKLVATAELKDAGSTEVHFQSTGTPLVLWADIKGSWRTDSSHPILPVHYDVSFFANRTMVGRTSCETRPSDHRVCSSMVTVGSQTLANCEDRLACEVPKLPPGDILMRVAGTRGGLGLVVMRNMSLNARAE